MKVQRNPAPVSAQPAPASLSSAAAPAAIEPTGWLNPKRPVAEVGSTSPAATEARNRAAAAQFFSAFGKGDHQTLEGLYRPDASFKDDMFTLSRRSSIMTMWKGAPPFKAFKAEVLSAEGDTVRARWTADYVMFGKPVHNVIESTLTFDGHGKVSSQVEHWDTGKWMSQALPIIPRWAQPIAYAVMRPLLSWKVGG